MNSRFNNLAKTWYITNSMISNSKIENKSGYQYPCPIRFETIYEKRKYFANENLFQSIP